MMQSADLRNGNDSTLRRRFDLALDRRVSIEREVRSGLVVVLEVRSQDATKMAFVEHDHMIETLSLGWSTVSCAADSLTELSLNDRSRRVDIEHRCTFLHTARTDAVKCGRWRSTRRASVRRLVDASCYHGGRLGVQIGRLVVQRQA